MIDKSSSTAEVWPQHVRDHRQFSIFEPKKDSSPKPRYNKCEAVPKSLLTRSSPCPQGHVLAPMQLQIALSGDGLSQVLPYQNQG
ncbi:Uncharacterized protein TCM_016165 [Theobroma cacao]|uniref:Uncharacterized protein n=1 Tax=Theobroma cacao TaxID=3641 RepID=A0A061GC28_THECC|nr:Uncharacterized protein TCM_016165 [Theobroma cacao]